MTPTAKPSAGEWQPVFLSQLAQTGNVRSSAEHAGIRRKTAYEHKKAAPDFAAAWQEAMAEACDRLEEIARTRAENGSDKLLVFLLRAHRPKKFRERRLMEHRGKLALRVAKDLTDEELSNIAAGSGDGTPPPA